MFVALGMRRASAMLSSVAWPALQYYVHYIVNGTIFVVKKLLKVKRVLIFIIFFFPEIVFILQRTEPDIITNVHRSSCKVPVILGRI